MDFGVVGFDSFLSPNSSADTHTHTHITLENGSKQHKWCGSGFLKQERINEDDEVREFKPAKTCSSTSCGDGIILRSPLQRSSDGHHQMLSFSSSSQTVTFPYYLHQSSSAFTRNTGYGSIGTNGAGIVSGYRGPFTPSQWMELEHQALIYKYITANVPIPSYLLNPIRNAFESAGFSAFSGLRSNPLGWGAFHLGFSSTDPEPGRCRRTDGKKWRCSRDAVADQKYCERHMNRGRHRSRKPVEGQPGHSATGRSTTTTTTTTTKLTSMASSTVPAGGVSNSLSQQHHLSNLQHGINRNVANKENVDGAYNHAPVLSMISPKLGLKEDSYEFGLVCSDSLLNPLNNCRSYTTLSNLDNHNNKSQNSLRQFIDAQPDRTLLSISIPMATSDTPSPVNEKLEMGLGMGTTRTPTHPISWEPSMGGPLGEVLHTIGECKTTKPLNLIDSWDNSPKIASSPTGVLQRGSFGSFSNSSTGSSPRAAAAECSKTTQLPAI